MPTGFIVGEDMGVVGEWENYQHLRIGDNIAVLVQNKVGYFKISNMERVPWGILNIIPSQNSSNSLAGSSTLELGNLSRFFEPSTDTMYVLRIGVYADREVHVITRYTGTTGELGGTAQFPRGGRFTATNDPYMAPRVIIKSWTSAIVPSFTLENRSRLVCQLLNFGFQGYKWSLEPIKTRPQYFQPVSLMHIGETGQTSFGEAISPGPAMLPITPPPAPQVPQTTPFPFLR